MKSLASILFLGSLKAFTLLESFLGLDSLAFTLFERWRGFQLFRLYLLDCPFVFERWILFLALLAFYF